jgi:hypothetical protein
MTDTDTAGQPLFHLLGTPVAAGADDPARLRLTALQSALMDEQQWADADLVGWLVDDLDRLPQPWGRVVRLLVGGRG